MYLVVGLGNPEERFLMTRHNFGFMVIDKLANKFEQKFRPGKGKYYFLKTGHKGKDLILVKPTTYMNNSGIAVSQVLNYFKIELDYLLVIYDDLDLDLGRIRFRAKGGSGGNKGIESVIYNLGTTEFCRLRLGINSDKRKSDDTAFVLSEFSKKEKEIADLVTVYATDAVIYWIENGITKSMNKFNSLNLQNQDNIWN